jgi:dolichol-phosphate mannosyltransferase
MPSSVAIVMPAFNEADGIVGFLGEVDDAFADWPGEATIVVVDDASTDGTPATAARAAESSRAGIVVVEQVDNRGHGPTTVHAYRQGLDRGADVVVQVDGDGQCSGREIRAVADRTRQTSAIVCGRRVGRVDPWYRRVITAGLTFYLRVLFGVSEPDANCPLRGYPRAMLEPMLERLPEDALIPNVYLSVLAAHDEGMLRVPVHHRERRGDSPVGSTWRSARRGIPRRLVKLVQGAIRESWELREGLRSQP